MGLYDWVNINHLFDLTIGILRKFPIEILNFLTQKVTSIKSFSLHYFGSRMFSEF